MKDPLKKFYRKERLRKKIFWLSRAISRIQPEGQYYEMNIVKLLTKPYTVWVTIYKESCIEKIIITRTTYKYLRMINRKQDKGWRLIREGKTEDIVL